MPVVGVKYGQVAKISGGEYAIRGEFPHHAAIFLEDEVFGCGASIISTLLLLTAAHCLERKNPKGMKVIAGEYDRDREEGTEQIRAVKAIYLHENYTRTGNSLKNDIGIILLEEPFNYTKYVRNISMPKSGEEFTSQATLAGWGRQNEDSELTTKLRKVVVPQVLLEECRRNYTLGNVSREVTDNMMCAGEPMKDSCKGDSGGGVICYRNGFYYNDIDTEGYVNNEVLCGIVSWAEGCALPGLPGVNTKVSRYIDWIENAAKKMSDRGRCRTNEFYCSSRCISRTAVCDSIKDCDDGEDEVGCFTYIPCAQDRFRCNKGFCISPAYICDGDNDCRDASDEFKCPPESGICTADEHQCGPNGRCIPREWVCNGLVDCDDISDEKNCTGKHDVTLTNMTAVSHARAYSDLQKCSSEELFCSSKCISRKFVCDGVQNCDDGSDELNCTYANGTDCKTTEFRCNNGRCVKRTWRCDEDNDCWDLTDELKCPPNDKICVEGEFQCGGSRRCIPVAWVCDGINDCGDHTDESNCPLDSHGSDSLTLSRSQFYLDLKRCNTNQFFCSSGCLPREVICNGSVECSDGTDENSCYNDESCDYDEFRCNNGLCHPKNYICDGDNDCLDGSEELKCPSKDTSTCANDEFQCGSGRRCIPISWKCNNMTDCDNGIDERGCQWNSDESDDENSIVASPSSQPCASNQFHCPNNPIFRDCVPDRWRCDGDADCSPPYDEQDCPVTTITRTTSTTRPNTTSVAPPRTCEQYEFPCQNVFNSDGCVPLWWKCDNDIDCTNGEDEEGCQEENVVEVAVTSRTIFNTSQTSSSSPFFPWTTTTMASPIKERRTTLHTFTTRVPPVTEDAGRHKVNRGGPWQFILSSHIRHENSRRIL